MKRAFTLVELLLVLVLMAVAAALSLPNFGKSYTGVELQKTADDLDYLMRYAQSRAIIHNRPLRLVFGPDMKDYRLEETMGKDEPPSWQPLSGRWGHAVRVPQDITLRAPEAFVDFLPSGSMTRLAIDVCHQQQCLIVSTQRQRGRVEVLEETSG